ncbi:unnamed protein product [Urochloa humidicola]
MAPPVAELLCPSTSVHCSDLGFASALGPEYSSPVGEDDEDDLLGATITYREVEEEPVDYEITCPGLSFTEEQQDELCSKWIERWSDLCVQYSDSCNAILSLGGDNAPRPPWPLKVLPETTYPCITRGYCYHREYMTNDTSRTTSSLGFSRPQHMMRIFSLKLSSHKSKSYPISVYGIIAIRDDLEPLRNYVFNRSRDDAVMIHQDSLALPLCSPCRGMYVLDRALLEVDLWVKKEGDGSTDEQLLSVYAEIDLGSSFDEIFTGRVYSEDCILDMDYTFLAESVEAIIQGKCVEMGELFTHVVALKAEEKLEVCLEWENSLLAWTFQYGTLGASSYPDDDSIPFYVIVLFAPKNRERGPSRYHAWKERCRNMGRKLPAADC